MGSLVFLVTCYVVTVVAYVLLGQPIYALIIGFSFAVLAYSKQIFRYVLKIIEKVRPEDYRAAADLNRRLHG